VKPSACAFYSSAVRLSPISRATTILPVRFAAALLAAAWRSFRLAATKGGPGARLDCYQV